MNFIARKVHQKIACNTALNYHLRKFLFMSTSCPVLNQTASEHQDLNNNSDLSKDLYTRIKLSGPISVANYMKTVLTHPTKGYYTTKDVFGQKGDFVTSPEVSQLFGEMIGLWILAECNKIHYKPFQIVELGPGRGTLTHDILRVFRQLGWTDRISAIHYIEVSPVLAKIQKEKLCSTIASEEITAPSNKSYQFGKTKDKIEIYWYKSIADLPEGFTVFIAQEFFDALPIHKFQKTKNGWFEVLVDVDPNSEKVPKFRYVLAKTDACDLILDKSDKREHVEISPEAMNIMRYISSAITQNGGFSLFVDYGHNGEKTDTFRAFRDHKQCDPLKDPGTADLTADVDFALLKKVAKESNKLLCYGPVAQREFLKDTGIDIRLMNLCKNATEEEKQQLKSGYDKIMNPNEMGTCFKVVSMFPYVLKDYFKKLPVNGFEKYESED
ncbi:hypothetical protein TSAR_001215 [Trichomalopsis sarcophagae]|uniref:Protein arginine methyltransferase NDUFAF7 n=1 Tax=Trichomalopsis sarcophagae TaxID=543379 RepID=A0A232F0R7_9HYME|nr:hypothetical protein TSAR_001215 [Trichomalopsis sarcophagae]